MTDENTTTPSTGSTPDLPKELVDAAPSATFFAQSVEGKPTATKNAESSTPDLPRKPVDVTPPFTIGLTPAISKAWHMWMLFLTISLFVLGIYSFDKSVSLYIALGVVAISITPVVKMINAIRKRNELREYKEQKRKAAEKSIHLRANLSKEEKQEVEMKKIKAANEFAKRHAANSENTENA